MKSSKIKDKSKKSAKQIAGKAPKKSTQAQDADGPIERLINRYKSYFLQDDQQTDLFDQEQLNDFVQNKVKPILLKGSSVADVNGIPKDLLEELYAVGYHLFAKGDYMEAARMFTFVALQNHKEARYCYAAGRCFEHLGEYDIALKYYFSAVSAEKTNPEYLCRLSYCLYILGQMARALDGFNIVVTLVNDNPVYRDIATTAQAMLEMILSDENATKSRKRNKIKKRA